METITIIKEPVDIQALAQVRYPGEGRELERAAFVAGFLTADPGKAEKSPDSSRCKWGARTGFFRSMEIGQTVQVPIVDAANWRLWRSTASHLREVYGCRFSITRDREDRTMLNIHRYE